MALYKFLDFNDHTCHRLNVNILEQNDVKKNLFFWGGGGGGDNEILSLHSTFMSKNGI